jgi:hypothetical protein
VGAVEVVASTGKSSVDPFSFPVESCNRRMRREDEEEGEDRHWGREGSQVEWAGWQRRSVDEDSSCVGSVKVGGQERERQSEQAGWKRENGEKREKTGCREVLNMAATSTVDKS